MKVLVIRESILESLVSDIFTFGCIAVLCICNHLYGNGSVFLDFCIFVLVVFSAYCIGSDQYSPQDAEDALKELINNKQKKEEK